MKRVFVYTRKMSALKTEVLGQSSTTAATGLTSFIYLKHKSKKNTHEIKDPSANVRSENQQSLRAKSVSTRHVAITRVMLNASFVLESLR